MGDNGPHVLAGERPWIRTVPASVIDDARGRWAALPRFAPVPGPRPLDPVGRVVHRLSGVVALDASGPFECTWGTR
jgi:hypothetical protein